ncbi:MAG: type II toxin-antitoxin system PemK/MazF family toxin [Bdellovibrionales bacterium]
MVVRKGDLVWVQLPPPRGSEPAGRRPALVIQSDAFNLSRIGTVIVSVITSNLKYESLPGNVRLFKGESGIPKASVINFSQIHTLDRTYIEEKIGTLSNEKLLAVDAGLKTIFDLN